ncbi:MAG: hypothetical protein A3K19_33515 [Lentisphaerae bacterium RIFOXYB12_FULL_65_16]|nr:MAG: hypothetical protein A3K18_06000 [Lentisphaerae bacterium RIFOXYA12_64_32]OGV86948.1 MAG: hypothetical protein A3K19_33515 [Lentisphaerae bacterium RIFOXYB12_FULL_65_16]
MEIKQTKRRMAMAEIPAGMAWSGIGVTYLTGFFLLLKANSFQIGLISAIPALCSVAAVLGGFLLHRWQSRKTWVIALLAAFYLSHAFLGTIPYLLRGYPAALQVYLGLAVLAGAYILVKINDVFWYPWASAIIPEGQRGSFFGRLMIVSTLVTMPFSYLVGQYLDRANNAQGFLIVFGLCGLVGTLVTVTYARIPDVRGDSNKEQAFRLANLSVPCHDKGFRKFLLFAGAETLATGLCGPFTTVFMLETLHIPFTLIAVFGIIYSLFFIVFVVVWGYLVDKYGSRPVLLLCSAPSVVVYFLWIFNTPQQYYLIFLIHACSGITAAGVGVALQNQLMGVSTGKHSTAYVSVFQIVTGVVGFAAPLLGSAVVQMHRNITVDVFGFAVGQYQVLFGMAGVLSVLPLFFIVGLSEPRGKTALFILRNMLMVNPLKLALHLFSFHRSFGEKERLNATMGLGSTGSPMVLSELVVTLDDPIYFVRREAALALGRIGDRDAVMPLIAKLSDENANIQYEAAWALGNIRDEQSIPPLLECLKSPDPKLRGYAATALGEIGASVAIEPLLERLENSQDVFETTCAANALSRLGYKKALWKTLEQLVRSDQPVVRRQLSVSLGDLLGEQGSFYRLLNREERVYGEEVRRLLTRMGKAVDRRWKPKLGTDTATRTMDGLKRVDSLYGEKRYPEALREVVGVCDLLFGPEIHRYNHTQEIGRRFLHELLSQNEVLGNRVYWEECLVSIYELDLIFHATDV